MKKICKLPSCGKEFETSIKRKTFCCYKCRDVFYKFQAKAKSANQLDLHRMSKKKFDDYILFKTTFNLPINEREKKYQKIFK